MSIRHLNTAGFSDAAKALSDAIETYNECLKTMQTTTNTILDNWIGKGCNEFATQVRLINGKLEDISDELYEMYKAIVQAEKAYIDTDQAMAKELNINKK